MQVRKLKKNYNTEEYLKFEERSPLKHEFHNGELYAMAGETVNHSQLCVNTITALNLFFKGKPCHVHDSNMKVHIKTKTFEKFLYPDVSVTCHPKDHQNRSFIEHPKVIIEILSKSTALYDRTDEFQFYKYLHSLENYILINQNYPLIEVFQKVPKQVNTWLLTTYDQELFTIPSIDFKGSIIDLYDKVSL